MVLFHAHPAAPSPFHAPSARAPNGAASRPSAPSSGAVQRPPAMSIFNPKILDASITAVTTSLRDDQKADVLLYATRHLQLEGSRTLIENAVQSCLQIPNLTPATAAKVRMLRVKARLAAGVRHGIDQELQAILALDPDHAEAKAHLFRAQTRAPNPSSPVSAGPPFSSEIWRGVALCLPRKDLKTLLSVPHVLSRIASRLLFQEISLHFGLRMRDESGLRLDDRAEARNAEILTRIIMDPDFAALVRTLRVYAPSDAGYSMAFQTGMVAHALAKTVNLQNIHVRAKWQDILSIAREITSNNLPIRGLSIACTDKAGLFHFPRLKHIARFSYTAPDDAPPPDSFITQNRDTIRVASLSGSHWPLSARTLSFRNLAYLDFEGTIESPTALAEVLRNGHQLESLRLCITARCALAPAFDLSTPGLLPVLHHFAFYARLLAADVDDHGLFPAVAALLRDRARLRVLHLGHAHGQARRLGYDAAVWGVLPSLAGVRGLRIALPPDVAPGLAAWLLPRGLRALELCGEVTDAAREAFVPQLRSGLPPALRFIGLADGLYTARVAAAAPAEVRSLVERGFPMVRLAHVAGSYWTIVHDGAGAVTDVEQWDERRTEVHAREWLEWLGCEDSRCPAMGSANG